MADLDKLPPASMEELERIAEHMELALAFIDAVYPNAEWLDRGPIMRNIKRWSRMLRAAISGAAGPGNGQVQFTAGDMADAAVDGFHHSQGAAGGVAFADRAPVPSWLLPVLAEIERATAKFPSWPTDPLHAIAVVGEEHGETVKAILQAIYEPQKSGADAVETEAVQAAAMALRFVMSLDRYTYSPSAQHGQEVGHG